MSANVRALADTYTTTEVHSAMTKPKSIRTLKRQRARQRERATAPVRGSSPCGWFWDQVTKGPECWTWTGTLVPSGYGSASLVRDGRLYRCAHRVSWFLHHGHIEDGLWVLHRCDNPACVRPDHLYLGTSSDNVRDRDERVRSARGDRSGVSRLSDADALRMYEMRRDEATATRALADLFGVSQGTVRNVINGKRYIFGERMPSLKGASPAAGSDITHQL